MLESTETIISTEEQHFMNKTKVIKIKQTCKVWKLKEVN